jgi:hypothetical protein
LKAANLAEGEESWALLNKILPAHFMHINKIAYFCDPKEFFRDFRMAEY